MIAFLWWTAFAAWVWLFAVLLLWIYEQVRYLNREALDGSIFVAFIGGALALAATWSLV